MGSNYPNKGSMNKSGLFIQLALLTISCTAIAKIYNPHNTVVVVDEKHVICKHTRPGFKDFKALASGKTFKKLPTIVYLLTFKYKKIKKYGFSVTENIKGTANIIHEVLRWMKQKKYGDLTSLESDILNISVPMKLRKNVIPICKSLKAKGATIFLDSDMDTIHEHVLTRKIKKSGTDLSFATGSIAITPYDLKQRPSCKHYEGYSQIDSFNYAVNENKFLPKRYSIMHSIVGADKDIVFIVRHIGEADAARAAGFDVILFNSEEQLRSELKSRGLLN
jgi:hypothetical protein